VNARKGAGRVWAAIQIGDARSVQPCERIDAQGLETRSSVPLEKGTSFTVALRFSGGSSRIFEVPVRVAHVDGRIDSHSTLAVRLNFTKDADPGVLREVATLSDALGLFRGEMPALAPEPTPAPVRGDGPLRATAQGESAAWVLRFDSPEERRAVGLQILSGSLFVETRRPPPLNSHLLLRLDEPGGRPVYVETHVNYVSGGQNGPPGVGLTVERVPAVIADALRR
jgi:hypothetical protein